GSTVATNMIIERKGAPLALLTTTGCRYVLHIGRHDVPKNAHMYLWVKPPRLVTPEHIYEIPERLDHTGAVLEPLDEAACIALLTRLQEQRFPVLAISLLHAYANPLHEQRLKALCAQYLPDTPLSISSEVLPQFREYERTMATVLNAYVLPHVGSYYGRLDRRMYDMQVRAPLLIMKSNGGMASATAAAAQPVLTVLSGPAAAVVGAIAIGRQAGFSRCISIDVGGTSADVCLAEDEHPTLTTEGEIADLPLPFPMIDVHSIGAGGGSIARLTASGGLQVGPESAGADPGPVCYDQGGQEPTTTDANLVLGRLATELLGGALRLHHDKAYAAIAERIARPLQLSVEAAAYGMLEILNNTMAGAIRAISIERGYDPRDFALLACGGAGPLHAGRLAELLEIPTVIIPRYSGVLSTLGLLHSDIKNDYVRTLLQRHHAFDPVAINTAFDDLAQQARQWLTEEGIPPSAQQLARFADLRYANQGYELTVAVPEGSVTPTTLEQTLAAFHQEHERLYTYASPELPVELVNLRVSAQGPARPVTLQPLDAPVATSLPPPAQRAVYFPATGFLACPVYDYAMLPAGARLTGPAIITQDLSTIVVQPQHQVSLDRYGNIIMTIPQHHA
ncbi:MAG: hydantoinase/oxoprolinase family protein, partial [Candidatus Tectomicrobia bacterium]|nr:hydantoinase/oxoprolinase family protein [Candidatus Tectomicrobia bacterium]